MTFKLKAEEIAKIIKSPPANVKLNWPDMEAALLEQGIKYASGICAALATVAVECRTFLPIHEYGGP